MLIFWFLTAYDSGIVSDLEPVNGITINNNNTATTTTTTTSTTTTTTTTRFYFFKKKFKASLEQFYVTIINFNESVNLCFFILYYTWKTNDYTWKTSMKVNMIFAVKWTTFAVEKEPENFQTCPGTLHHCIGTYLITTNKIHLSS